MVSLESPFDVIIFDCDGTLSAIEGIDELARRNNVGDAVEEMTQEAMGRSGMNVDLYRKRLMLVKPTLSQVKALGKDYFNHRTPDSLEVIQLLKRLSKKIYIISAGLTLAVSLFAETFAISRAHVFAVDITFDHHGNYHDFDHTSPLIRSDGKRDIIRQLKNSHEKIAYIGDGLNDYAVYDLVDRFIGYGGVFYRKNIADRCEYYIHTPSMAAMLPYVLTWHEQEQLTSNEKILFRCGLNNHNNSLSSSS